MSEDKRKRRETIIARLQPGRIVEVDTQDADHRKYLILAAVDPVLCGFYINHEITDFVKNRPWLHGSQVEIAKTKGRPYLKQDVSFANCSNLITSVPRASVITQAVADPTRIKDMITDEEKTAIIQVIEESETISARQRAYVLKALQWKD